VQQADATQRTSRKPTKMPWVNPVMCEGCGDCVQRCPRKGLKMTETNVEGVFVPWLDQPEACSGCGKCASDCVSGAIQMTEYVDRAMARFKEKRPMIPV
jgi:NAD-dependent dihydropyrimidine dehydrogenase PreA subunit